MEHSGQVYSRLFSRRFLYLILTVSIATNVILIAKLRYPNLLKTVMCSLIPAPKVLPADHVRGKRDAKNTVIVYTDFQCPFCATLHNSLNFAVASTDTRWILRHFPRASHTLAGKAAEAAECSGEQKKFWEYCDALYNLDEELTEEVFNVIAVRLGLNKGSFAACLNSGKHSATVLDQIAQGEKLKIDGTPTTFINGKRYVGVISVAELNKLLGGNVDCGQAAGKDGTVDACR